MQILPYDPGMNTPLADLLVEYFTDMDAGIPENTIRTKILSLFLQGCARNALEIALATEADHCIGFSIYQIDSGNSDWCKRPGWGCIREFYIRPDRRRQGLGQELAGWTENRLREMGATHLYLTADDALAFWTFCGFVNSHETCSNELEILTK